MLTTLHNQLIQLGFTSNQTTVYLSLITVGIAKAGELIKATGLHRNLVYVALQELIAKKLVTSSQVHGVATYKALSPTRLLAEVQEKELIAKNTIQDLLQLTKKGNGQEIIVYEGIDEFRRHVIHTFSAAKPKQLIRYLGISPRWHEIVGPALERDLIQIQKEKGIRMRGLAKSISKPIDGYIQTTRELTTVKTNPLISSDTSGTEILDDRISILSFVEPYFVVEIIQPELAKNYRNYFDFLWEQS